MKANQLAGALGRESGAEHALIARDERREQVAPRRAVLLRNRERTHRCCRAWMNADAGLAQIIELKGMGKCAVGQCRGRRADATHRRAQNRASAVTPDMM